MMIVNLCKVVQVFVTLFLIFFQFLQSEKIYVIGPCEYPKEYREDYSAGVVTYQKLLKNSPLMQVIDCFPEFEDEISFFDLYKEHSLTYFGRELAILIAQKYLRSLDFSGPKIRWTKISLIGYGVGALVIKVAIQILVDRIGVVLTGRIIGNLLFFNPSENLEVTDLFYAFDPSFWDQVVSPEEKFNESIETGFLPEYQPGEGEDCLESIFNRIKIDGQKSELEAGVITVADSGQTADNLFDLCLGCTAMACICWCA